MILICHGTGVMFTRKYTGATSKKVFSLHEKADAI